MAEPPGVEADSAARRLSLLLESTGEGIFGVDTDGCCTFINRAAAAMIGWPAEAVLGRNMHALIHHTHADGRHYPEACCPIFNAFRQGLPCRIDDEKLWRRDGSSFWAEYSSHPMLDGGAVRGAVVTFVDISERRLADELLRQARDELEQRVAARTAELSAALGELRALSAHLDRVREEERTRIARDIHDELGAFLVGLKMDIAWLRGRVADRPELDAKGALMAHRVDRAVDTVSRIVTDLRPGILDHGGLWAALEWQVAEFAAATGIACDAAFHVEHGAEVPPGAAGDRYATAVFRMFQELLSNVARHARAGTVHLRVYVDGPPSPVLHVTLRDDGIGLDAATLSRPGHFGVRGLRERAAHFGGQVAWESVPGAGTTVRLRMPLPAAEATDGSAPT